MIENTRIYKLTLIRNSNKLKIKPNIKLFKRNDYKYQTELMDIGRVAKRVTALTVLSFFGRHSIGKSQKIPATQSPKA